jgi:hypothetical protein
MSLQDKTMQDAMKYAICDSVTVPYPIIRPRLTLPAKTGAASSHTVVIRPQFTLPARIPVKRQASEIAADSKQAPRPSLGRSLSIIVSQLIYAAFAVEHAVLAYSYLAAWPVYRFVAIAIIAILWSNIAGAAAIKKSVAVLNTMKVRAIQSTAFIDTNVFLKSIKSSFLGHSNEIR